MIPIRWYLKRDTDGAVLLVVEERAEPRRGYCIGVTTRADARTSLHVLAPIVAAIDDPSRYTVTSDFFDPVPADG